MKQIIEGFIKAVISRSWMFGVFILICNLCLGPEAHAEASILKTFIPSTSIDTQCPLSRHFIELHKSQFQINNRKPCLGLFVDLNSDGLVDFILINRNLSIGKDSHGKSAESEVLIFLQDSKKNFVRVQQASNDEKSLIPGHVDGLVLTSNENDTFSLFLSARPGHRNTRFTGGLFLINMSTNGRFISQTELKEIPPRAMGERGESESILSETLVVKNSIENRDQKELYYQTRGNSACFRYSRENYKIRNCK